MAIIQPIDMPNPLPVREALFNLTPIQQVTPTGSGGGGGFLQSIDRASPMWLAKYVTRPLDPISYQSWTSWLDQLEGSNTPFKAFSPRFPVPYAFMSQMPGALTNSPWGPGSFITSISYADSSYMMNGLSQGTLGVAGLLSGTVLTAGDMISYQNGYIWQLYRVAQTVTINGSMANTAWTMTDSSASAILAATQAGTVPNDSTTYTFIAMIAKTAGGTSKTFGIDLSLTGGTTVNASARINTDTGVDLLGNATILGFSTTYWEVKLTITNNTSGNTTLTANLKPATANYNSSSDVVTATGSAVVFAVQTTPGTWLQQSNNFSASPWTNNLTSLTQNATGPGASGKIAVKARPQDAINNGAWPKTRFSKPCCAMKMIGTPQWSDSVDSYPICTINAAQYLERGT